MNLYEILTRHYSPKDSQEGIFTYLVAESDEDVYEFLKKGVSLDSRWLYTTYEDNEEDYGEEEFEIYDKDYNVIGTECYKYKIIRLKGDMFDEDIELCDLYYGLTLNGWRLVAENVAEQDIETIKRLGISLSFTDKAKAKNHYQECWNKFGCIFNSNISPKYKKCWQDNYSVEQCERDNKNQGGSCL